MLRLPISLFLLPLAAQFTASVSAQTILKPRFEENTRFRAEETINCEQTLTFNVDGVSTKSETKSESRTVAEHSFGKLDAKGNLSIAVEMELFQVEASLPGGQHLKFNSARPDETAASPQLQSVVDNFRKAAGAVIRYKVSPGAKGIGSIDLATIETQVDAIDPQKTMQRALDMFPDKPVALHEEWERSEHHDLGGGQMFTFLRTYRYAGQVDQVAATPGVKLEKITATDSSVEYSVRPNMGIFVVKSDLQVASSKHTYLFDPARGRIVDEMHEIRVKGKLAVSANKVDSEGDVDFSLVSRWRELN